VAPVHTILRRAGGAPYGFALWRTWSGGGTGAASIAASFGAAATGVFGFGGSFSQPLASAAAEKIAARVSRLGVARCGAIAETSALQNGHLASVTRT